MKGTTNNMNMNEAMQLVDVDLRHQMKNRENTLVADFKEDILP